MEDVGIGDMTDLTRDVVEGLVAIYVRHEMPGAGRTFLAMLRALVAHAIALGWRRDDPTEGVTPKLRKGSRWPTWGEAEIAKYRDHWKLGTMARLALELLLGSDAVLMGWQNILPGGNAIEVRRVQKTGVALVLPISPKLRAAIDAMPKGMTFLTIKGHPFKPGAFSQWFARQCRYAGVPPATPRMAYARPRAAASRRQGAAPA